MKTDKAWDEIRKNPPADWREVWRHRAMISRHDTEEQAKKALGNLTDDLSINMRIDIHPKDGHVVYAEPKRFEDCKGDIKEFLQVGDLVDNEIADEFINVLPPATYNSKFIQMGEPYSHVNGRATFQTLRKTPYGWVYAGCCHIAGERPSIIVKYIGEDDWGRKTYKRVDGKGVFKLVDGWYHTATDYGEPDCSIKREINVIVQE